MNTETETLILVLRGRMEKMTTEERLDLMHSLMEDYCEKCGIETGGMVCYCTRDD